MLRWIGGFAAAGSIGLAALALPGAAAHAADQLVMPYACTATAGRVALTASAEQTYRIVGLHEQQPFTACAPNNPDRCRTWMVHKFELECGGQRVTWLTAVGALMEHRPWRGWIADERVHLRMGPQWGASASAAVPPSPGPSPGQPPGPAQTLPPATQGGPQSTGLTAPDCIRVPRRFEDARDPRRPRPFGPECAPRFLRSPPSVVVMPAGFAPVLETGARFASLPAVASGQDAAAARRGPKDVVAKGAGETTSGATAGSAAAPVAIAKDAAGKDTWATTATRPPAREPSAAEPSGARQGWVTALYRTPPGGIDPGAGAEGLGGAAAGRLSTLALGTLVAGFAGSLALLAGSFLLLRNRARSAAAGAGAATDPRASAGQELSSEDREQAAESAGLIRTADTLHAAVRDTVAALDPPQLRDALLEDLGRIEHTLLAPELTRLVAAREWGAARGILQGVLRDLERVRKLADGVRAGKALGAAMPATRQQALALLGVGPDADEKVVKKIVDALRQSWHPDLASSTDDRSQREERLKQINIAWDIICGRQKAAA